MRTGFLEIPRNFSNSSKNAGFRDYRDVAESRKMDSPTDPITNFAPPPAENSTHVTSVAPFPSEILY